MQDIAFRDYLLQDIVRQGNDLNAERNCQPKQWLNEHGRIMIQLLVFADLLPQ